MINNCRSTILFKKSCMIFELGYYNSNAHGRINTTNIVSNLVDFFKSDIPNTQ